MTGGRNLLALRAGPVARTHIRANGLAPRDIVALPAAAGGPKGLGLIPLDRMLHEDWLARADHVHFLGASIGAWRATALASPDPPAMLERLRHAYVRGQNYPANPSPELVSATIRGIVRALLAGSAPTVRTGASLDVIVTQARGALAKGGSRRAFARAALGNAVARRLLAAHMGRVAFYAGAAPSPFTESFDAFGWTSVQLDDSNAEDALLASGSIPLLCAPVRDIAGGPPGACWDGGLVDYHLLLPYPRLRGIVLYPHFVPHVTAGWLDQHLPWRRRARGHRWLDNVLVIAPAAAFLATLPNGQLPQRQDFYRYGTDHAARICDWERAIGECGRFAEAAMRWLEDPDPGLVGPL